MRENKMINQYSVWGAAAAFLCTSIIWILGLSMFSHSADVLRVDKNQLYQEQIDRLSHIAALSAEMSLLRKKDSKDSAFDPILQEIVNQIAGNVIINAVYEFEGNNLVQFDVLDGVF